MLILQLREALDDETKVEWDSFIAAVIKYGHSPITIALGGAGGGPPEPISNITIEGEGVSVTVSDGGPAFAKAYMAIKKWKAAIQIPKR